MAVTIDDLDEDIIADCLKELQVRKIEMNPKLTTITKSSITLSPSSESESILNDFQRNALDKLEAREVLARSNMLTVKVKLSKGLKLKGISKVTKAITVNVDIYSTADELAAEIASKLLVIQGKRALRAL